MKADSFVLLHYALTACSCELATLNRYKSRTRYSPSGPALSDCLYLTFSPDIDWNFPRDTTQKEKTGKVSMSILNEVVLTAHVLSNLHNLHNRWDDTVTAVCCHGPGNSERWGIIGLFGNWMYAVIWGKACQSWKRLSWELQWETWSE